MYKNEQHTAPKEPDKLYKVAPGGYLVPEGSPMLPYYCRHLARQVVRVIRRIPVKQLQHYAEGTAEVGVVILKSTWNLTRVVVNMLWAPAVLFGISYGVTMSVRYLWTLSAFKSGLAIICVVIFVVFLIKAVARWHMDSVPFSETRHSASSKRDTGRSYNIHIHNEVNIND